MQKTAEGKGFFGQIINGVLVGLTVILVGVLIFAAIIKIATLGSTVIKSVNQFIKVVAVFLGCFFSVKNGKGLIKGVLIGVSLAVITTLIFSLVGSNIEFGYKFILDTVFLAVVGGISGIISVNVRKN